LDLESGETHYIADGALPQYLSTGHLTWTADDNLMAARFDPEKMELLGPPVAVMDGFQFLSLSDDGKLFYSVGTAGGAPRSQLLWVTRSGDPTLVDSTWIFERVASDHSWRISPDGSRVALRELTADGNDIWIKQLDGGPRSRLTFGTFDERMPEWVPGTSLLSFTSARGGGMDVWKQSADGTGEAELVLDFERDIATYEWSPDGQWMVIRTSGPRGAEGGRDLYVFRPGVDSTATPLLADQGYDELYPSISPDGRFIAYQTTETDRHEIYVRPFPDVTTGRWQVSVAGGRNPQWANSGREIFFNGPNNQMMVVEVETTPTFRAGTPRVLFERVPGTIFGDINGVVYDVAPDDQRFLMARDVPAAGTDVTGPRTILVNNFVEEIRARVP
jgi:serine/threonine-protein kinase